MKCSLLTLSAYVDDELEPARQGELEAHLVGCERCRGGVEWLREEAVHVGALAPVRVPDHAAHALFEQLGLVGAAEPLPPRSVVDRERPPAPALVPWMTSAEDSGALPWRASSRPAAPPPVDGDVHLTGRPAPAGAGSFGGREPATPPAPASGDGDDGASPRDATPGPGAPAGGWAEQPDVTAAQPDLFDPIPAPDPARPAATPPATGGAPMVMPSHSDSERSGAPPSPTALQSRPRYGEAHIDISPRAPMPEQAPPYGPPPGPGMAPAGGGPVPAPTSPLSRLLDRFAVRRALSRGDREFDDSVQVFSGRGAPLQSARTRVRTEREAGRQRALTEDAPPGPVELRGESAVAPDDAGELAARHRPRFVDGMPLRHRDGAAEPREHTAPRARGVIDTAPRRPRRPGSLQVEPLGRRVAALRERVDARGRITATLAGAGTVSRRLRPGTLRGSRIVEGDRRPLAAFAGAVALLLLLGLGFGKHSTALPLAAGQQPAVVAPAAPHAAAPAAPSAPSAPAVKNPVVPPAPAGPAPNALTQEQVVGSGGSGWTVAGIRYGVHPGIFRIVFDFTGSTAQGTPQATIGVVSGTLRVELAGVTPSGALGQVPVTAPVSGVSLVQPSPLPGAAVYQFQLSRPIGYTAYYLSGPLRLVIDVR